MSYRDWSVRLNLRLPRLDVPVLDRRWLVWMPPGYGLFDADPRWLVEPVRHVTWSQRIFGPLGRPAPEPVFDPSRPSIGGNGRAACSRAKLKQRPSIACWPPWPRLGEVDRSSHAEKLKWGELLSRWKTVEPVTQFKLLADSMRLAEVEFDADTVVPAATRRRRYASRRVAAKSKQPDATGARRHRVVYTPVGAALVRDQLLAPRSGVACGVANGSLAEELAAAAIGKSSRLMNFDAWSVSAAATALPWTLPGVALDDLSGQPRLERGGIDLPETLARPIHIECAPPA